MPLDKKNRKILYELDKDARQSLTTIGRKIGLPKNVVSYRIKKLENEGIIKNYYIAVDASKLGYFSVDSTYHSKTLRMILKKKLWIIS